jgi:hypothetical protein
MKQLLIDWMSAASEGKAGDSTWISKIRIDHHADREIVAWAVRDAEESAEDFAERVYALAQNDAEAIGSGDQLYMLRVWRPGNSGDQERRPLRVFQGLPEHVTHSLSSLSPITDSPQFQAAVEEEVARRLRRLSHPEGTLFDRMVETPEERAQIDAEARDVLTSLHSSLANLPTLGPIPGTLSRSDSFCAHAPKAPTPTAPATCGLTINQIMKRNEKR